MSLKMNHHGLLALALTVMGASSAVACDLCAIYSAQEAQGGGKGIFAGVAEQYTDFNSFKSAGQSAPNTDHASIHSLSSQMFVGYNFNKWVGIQFTLPVIYREYNQVAAHGSDFGLGDASLIGNFQLYQTKSEDFTFAWTALGGIKLPTGDSSWLGKPDFAAGIGGHDLTLGSGSFDGLLGTGFSLRQGRLFINGQMQYAIRTEGSFQHQYANDWSWSGGPGVYLALKDNYTIALQATVSGESKGKDTFVGVQDEDSAETMVYLGPEIIFTRSDNFSAHIGADLPVSYDNSGDQVMPSYRIHAAVIWHF